MPTLDETIAQRVMNYMQAEEKKNVFAHTIEDLCDGLNARKGAPNRLTTKQVRQAIRGNPNFITIGEGTSTRGGRPPKLWALESVINQMTEPGSKAEGQSGIRETSKEKLSTPKAPATSSLRNDNSIRMPASSNSNPRSNAEQPNSKLGGGIVSGTFDGRNGSTGSRNADPIGRFERICERLEKLSIDSAKYLSEVDAAGESFNSAATVIEKTNERIITVTRALLQVEKIRSNEFSRGYEKGFEAGIRFAARNRAKVDGSSEADSAITDHLDLFRD